MATRQLLFILPNLEGGGAERVTLNLLRELADRDYEITLFLFKREGVYWDEVPENVRVVAALPAGERTRKHVWQVSRALNAQVARHDLVVGALEGWPTFLGYACGRLQGRPVVGVVHVALGKAGKEVWGMAKRRLGQWVYSRLDATVCVSKGVLETLETFLALSRGKRHAIPNAFVLPAAARARADTDGPPLLLAVGRLENRQKGFDLLIKAHARLQSKGLKNRLVILGEGPDRGVLERLLVEEGVEDSVTLKGFVTDIWHWYSQATVFVLSSHYEGLPVVLLEALAAGVPIVATDCMAGPREILADGLFGELVQPGDHSELADGIERVLTDPAYREQLSRSGPRRASEYSPEHIADQWEQVFADVL